MIVRQEARTRTSTPWALMSASSRRTYMTVGSSSTSPNVLSSSQGTDAPSRVPDTWQAKAGSDLSPPAPLQDIQVMLTCPCGISGKLTCSPTHTVNCVMLRTIGNQLGASISKRTADANPCTYVLGVGAWQRKKQFHLTPFQQAQEYSYNRADLCWSGEAAARTPPAPSARARSRWSGRRRKGSPAAHRPPQRGCRQSPRRGAQRQPQTPPHHTRPPHKSPASLPSVWDTMGVNAFSFASSPDGLLGKVHGQEIVLDHMQQLLCMCRLWNMGQSITPLLHAHSIVHWALRGTNTSPQWCNPLLLFGTRFSGAQH